MDTTSHPARAARVAEVGHIGPPAGDPAYRARFESLYEHLHRIARRELGSSRKVTLSTTVLVHEAFLKLDGAALDVSERGRFLALAARAMRCVLVDHARARSAEKRGGGRIQVTLATGLPIGGGDGELDLLAIEQALAELEALDPRLAMVVEYRFYGGLEFQEIADQLGLTPRTIHRDWRKARAFLAARLGDELPPADAA